MDEGEGIEGVSDLVRRGNLGTGAILGCDFFFFFCSLLSGCPLLLLSIQSGCCDIVDGSRVTTQRARRAGDKRTLWGDRVGWCGWCSVTHVVLCQRTGVEANDSYCPLSTSLLYFHLLLGVLFPSGASLLFEFCHQKWSFDIFPWFPGVVGTGIPFQANEILILRTPRPHVQYFLHFPLCHPFDQVRWWLQEVFTVFFGLLIGVEQLGIEDIVYLPMSWQLEVEIYVSDCLEDFERPISFWPQLLDRMHGVKICGFQPDSFPFVVWFVICGFDPHFLCVLHHKCRLLSNSL